MIKKPLFCLLYVINTIYLYRIKEIIAFAICFWVKKIANNSTLQKAISETPRCAWALLMECGRCGDASLPMSDRPRYFLRMDLS